MGLFAKKIKPVFSDQEFMLAKESEIREMLWHEEALGMALFSSEQRKAIEQGRRENFLAVQKALVIEPDRPIAQNNDVPSSADTQVPLENCSPIEAIDAVNSAAFEDQVQAIQDDTSIMNEKKLKEKVTLLEGQLRWARSYYTPSKLVLAFWGGSTFALLVQVLTQIYLDRYQIVPQKSYLEDELDYERRNNATNSATMQSNLVVSEFFRKYENCDWAIKRLYLQSEIMYRDGLKNKPKTEEVCKALADFDAERGRVVETCQNAFNIETTQIESGTVISSIEEYKAQLKVKLTDVLGKKYPGFLEYMGYGQCEKVAGKKP